jgi:hypothetical protein
MSAQVTALRQALAALYQSPEATVGEAVVRFSAVEMLCEFALRDVGDEADVGPTCLGWAATIERAEIAIIPGATEQGREVAPGTRQGMENGGEFLREREQAAVCGRLLIAESMDKRGGGQASGGDALGNPRVIDFREEAADLVPTGTLASLAGFADQHHEEVETMPGSVDHAVGRGPHGIAEGGEKLEENGGGMRLGVRGQSAHGQPGDAIEGSFTEFWIHGWARRGYAL